MKLNPIASNMTEVEVGNKKVLFSYKTPVAYVSYEDEKCCFFRTSKYWSATTSRHINKWLRSFSNAIAREIDQEILDGLVK